MVTPARSTPALPFGPFVLDVAKGELRKGNTLLKLQPQPFRVLVLLVERAGEIVSREEIQLSLWGEHTWVDFDGGINFCIRQIRSTLCDNAEQPRYVETVPRIGYRFIFPLTHAEPREQVIPISRAAAVQEHLVDQSQAPAVLRTVPDLHVVSAPPSAVRESNWRSTSTRAAFSILGILLVASAAILYFSFHRKPKLTEKDTVVIADFRNTTGDPVFDEALKQGLA